MQDTSSEKHCTAYDTEFRLEKMDEIKLIRIVVYGKKKDGRDFRNHLKYRMYHLNCRPYLANPGA